MLPTSTAGALADLCSLFGLRTIDSQMGDFLEDGYLSRRQVITRLSKFLRLPPYEHQGLIGSI